MTGDELRRLELTGFACWRVADELREVRHRFPAPATDRLTRQAQEVEELARTVAGDCAARIREAEEEEHRQGGARGVA